MTEQEIWKPIAGFEGCYEISNLGRVKSLARVSKDGKQLRNVPERILIQAKTNYPSVSLWKAGKLKVIKVHRLVATAFIDNPEAKPEVNHIDADRFNNKVSNLEWVTRQENVTHAHANGLVAVGEACSYSKLTDSQALDIKSSRGVNQYELAKRYGVSQALISRIQLGKRKVISNEHSA